MKKMSLRLFTVLFFFLSQYLFMHTVNFIKLKNKMLISNCPNFNPQDKRTHSMQITIAELRSVWSRSNTRHNFLAANILFCSSSFRALTLSLVPWIFGIEDTIALDHSLPKLPLFWTVLLPWKERRGSRGFMRIFPESSCRAWT